MNKYDVIITYGDGDGSHTIELVIEADDWEDALEKGHGIFESQYAYLGWYEDIYAELHDEFDYE